MLWECGVYGCSVPLHISILFLSLSSSTSWQLSCLVPSGRHMLGRSFVPRHQAKNGRTRVLLQPLRICDEQTNWHTRMISPFDVALHDVTDMVNHRGWIDIAVACRSVLRTRTLALKIRDERKGGVRWGGVNGWEEEVPESSRTRCNNDIQRHWRSRPPTRQANIRALRIRVRIGSCLTWFIMHVIQCQLVWTWVWSE